MLKHLLVKTSAMSFMDFSVKHFDNVSVKFICIFKNYCHRWSWVFFCFTWCFGEFCNAFKDVSMLSGGKLSFGVVALPSNLSENFSRPSFPDMKSRHEDNIPTLYEKLLGFCILIRQRSLRSRGYAPLNAFLGSWVNSQQHFLPQPFDRTQNRLWNCWLDQTFIGWSFRHRQNGVVDKCHAL